MAGLVRSERGFSLTEVLVSVLVSGVALTAIAILTGNLVLHRVHADSNSAASSLAEWKLEQLRAAGDPAVGVTPPSTVSEKGAPAVVGYRLGWTVVGDDPQPGLKRITVRVTHENDPYVATELETYYLP